MKTYSSLLLAILATFVFTGCFSSGGQQQGFVMKKPNWSSWQNSPAFDVGQSTLPADPVRNHSFSYSGPTPTGTVNYNRRKGSNNYVRKSWTDYGPETEFRQDTYDEESYSHTPDNRRRGAYWDQNQPR